MSLPGLVRWLMGVDPGGFKLNENLNVALGSCVLMLLRAWRDALQRGGGELRKRLDAAGARRKKLRLVSEEEVAYDSAKELGQQKEQQQPDLDDFDRRLRDAAGGD